MRICHPAKGQRCYTEISRVMPSPRIIPYKSEASLLIRVIPPTGMCKELSVLARKLQEALQDR